MPFSVAQEMLHCMMVLDAQDLETRAAMQGVKVKKKVGDYSPSGGVSEDDRDAFEKQLIEAKKKGFISSDQIKL